MEFKKLKREEIEEGMLMKCSPTSQTLYKVIRVIKGNNRIDVLELDKHGESIRERTDCYMNYDYLYASPVIEDWEAELT